MLALRLLPNHPRLDCRVFGLIEFRAVFALLLLPNRPRLDCRVSGLVEFRAVFALLLLPNRTRLDCRVSGLVDSILLFCHDLKVIPGLLNGCVIYNDTNIEFAGKRDGDRERRYV